MSERKALSKKIRFEVFKRDKFQCQYCGSSAPDVVLNVDHIDPVANGGTNELVNLITSCFDCNQGKKDRLLSDDTVVKKQRKQLEEIQARRDQLELMLEWKQSLDQFEAEKTQMIADYWASMMSPFSLTESGLQSLDKLLTKFGAQQVLDAIGIAQAKYVKYDGDGQPIQETVDEAFNKIGGICALQNRPEIEQKMAYVKGIARNRFGYWSNQKGSIILKEYVDALRQAGWDDARIVADLENEVMPRTKECKTWTEWREWLESWTADINKWEQQNKSEVSQNLSMDTLETHAMVSVGELLDAVHALAHLGKLFPNFDAEKFHNSILSDAWSLFDHQLANKQEVDDFILHCNSQTFFLFPEDYAEPNLGVLIMLQEISYDLINRALSSIAIHSYGYSEKDCAVIVMLVGNQMPKPAVGSQAEP